MDYEKSYQLRKKLQKEYSKHIQKIREKDDKKRSKHTKTQQEKT